MHRMHFIHLLLAYSNLIHYYIIEFEFTIYYVYFQSILFLTRNGFVHSCQLVSDLQVLRRLLDYLLRYDAVSFYSFLLSLRYNDM